MIYTLREGNSTLVQEIQEQLNGMTPACIVASVGGAGLLTGILLGLEKAGERPETVEHIQINLILTITSE